ncbi:HisA/HisF-related TIM barrel protein [Candidatus Pelagibacter sp.]|nr:HisA/HisF-related TIM barrel protein [Candidatus Pelagibacter sp.]|tara:strand:+ start:767 stop:1591 length:825 start_codon:yes stop_codon:yes gene_type:complete
MSSKKKRLVAIILFKNGNVVQSKLFKQHKVVGDPYIIIDRLSSWNADELIYLNIRPKEPITFRQDKYSKYDYSFDKIVNQVGKSAFMPLTVGGGIKTISDAEKYFEMGADKISINSQIYHNPKIVSQCSKIFGSQSVVASVDVGLTDDNKYAVYVDGGKKMIQTNIEDYIKKIEDVGAGEILLNSIHKDGLANGYDLELVDIVKKITNLPIIITGGVGNWEDFFIGSQKDVDAVAASNIFHFFENSYFEAVKYLNSKGDNFRKATISKITKIKD